jgi:cellulose biosynthesis protein BcsQ
MLDTLLVLLSIWLDDRKMHLLEAKSKSKKEYILVVDDTPPNLQLLLRNEK